MRNFTFFKCEKMVIAQPQGQSHSGIAIIYQGVLNPARARACSHDQKESRRPKALCIPLARSRRPSAVVAKWAASMMLLVPIAITQKT